MTRPPLLHTLSKLYEGQSYVRILMNDAFRSLKVRGLVVDIGGARNPDYFAYLRGASDAKIEPVDGMLQKIDFETDALPYADAAAITILMCNVLEHIFDYRHLLAEARRVLAPQGQLIGFVPFWVGYHPDPHDYFRYTEESLRRLLTEAGFTDIDVRPLGRGPIIANFNTIVLSVPRIMRPPLFIWYAMCDALFVWLRPASVRRHPLGFLFTASRQ